MYIAISIVFKEFDVHSEGKFAYIEFIRSVLPQAGVSHEVWQYAEALRKVIRKKLKEKQQDIFTVFNHFTSGSKASDCIPNSAALMEKMKLLVSDLTFKIADGVFSIIDIHGDGVIKFNEFAVFVYDAQWCDVCSHLKMIMVKDTKKWSSKETLKATFKYAVPDVLFLDDRKFEQVVDDMVCIHCLLILFFFNPHKFM